MIVDLTAVKRALSFIAENQVAVAVAAGLYGVAFAFQSMFTALAGSGVVGAAPIALGFGAFGFFGFVLAMASWGRIALEKPGGKVLGLSLGADEVRLTWAAFLIVILSLTVLGTAGLAVAFMIAALALINVDPEAPPPEAGDVDLFAMFGTGEWIVTGVIFTAFALFSLWFFLRLAMAYPATLEASRIQIMSVWPLSGKGRSVKILTTALAVALPGVIILIVFNGIANAVLGAYPASAQSASGEAGALAVSVPGFVLVSFLYGFGKAAFVGAPVCAALCALYRELKDAPPTAGF